MSYGLNKYVNVFFEKKNHGSKVLDFERPAMMIFLISSSLAWLNIFNEDEQFPLGTVPSADKGNMLLILLIITQTVYDSWISEYDQVYVSRSLHVVSIEIRLTAYYTDL